jgi:hypothetical protein
MPKGGRWSIVKLVLHLACTHPVSYLCHSSSFLAAHIISLFVGSRSLILHGTGTISMIIMGGRGATKKKRSYLMAPDRATILVVHGANRSGIKIDSLFRYTY